MRDRHQTMGVWLNEPAILNPELVDKSLLTLAEAGYGVVRLFLRNSNYSYTSPEVVALVGRAVELAHRLGMLAALDCEPHVIACAEMGRRHPDAMGSKLVHAEAKVVDGRWTMCVEAPKTVGADAILDGVEAAFLDGVPLNLDYQTSRETRSGAPYHREHSYAEGVALTNKRVYALSGKLAKPGTLVAYLRFSCRTLADFWSDGFKSYYDELLETYRGIPLDGVGWDEPAIDGDWNSYRYGSGFAAAFERLNGYRLRDKLRLLDAPGAPPEAVKVRLDYYRTLNEGLAQAQANLIKKARELFGPDLILGTHHTWQGEGGINDYRAGAVDYFRLNDNMDAGYTDCSWWDPASVAYAYTLASSLGRLTPSGEAEANTWHNKPTVANIRANVNLMSLMDITWFNIWFGSDSDTCLNEGHHTWPETAAQAKKHRSFQRLLGRRRPVVDIAIWHGWEGVCAWNTPTLANAQKAFCLNTSHLFVQRNLAADFIDSRLLATSHVEDGRLTNQLGAYKALVVPYALAMPRKAFERCAEFAKSGGLVVFVGMPVCLDEDGSSLAADFALLAGVPAMDAAEYLAGLDVKLPLRPQRLEVCRPLPDSLPNKLVSIEGEVHGAVNGSTVFLTDLDPGQRLVEWLEKGVVPAEFVAHGDNLLARLYRGPGGDALVVAAKDERPLRGVVRWQGRTLELQGGSAGWIAFNGAAIMVTGDIVCSELK